MPYEGEDTVVGALSHAHDTYMSGATGTPVQDDQDARVVTANATHSEVTNETFTSLQSTTVAYDNVNAEVYSGGDVVAPVNATWFESQVRTALDADALFTTGGPYTSDYSLLSPYVDNLVLIEASKLTGEKLF